MCYAVFAAIWARGEAMKHSCKGIEVEITGESRADTVTRNGVLTEIESYPHKLVGMRLDVLDTKGVENYLRQYSNFEDVECSVTTDGTLKVRITPMNPVLRVFDEGNSYYINKDGKIIRSKASFFVDVPVVKGKFNEEFTAKSVLPVVRFVEKNPVLNQLVGMIYAPDPNNIMLVPRIHGHVVNFGDTTRLEEKTKALLSLYRKVMPYKGWETYDTISVKFQGQVVATRRDKRRLDHGGIYDDLPDMEEATLPEI